MAKQYKIKSEFGTFYYKDPSLTIQHREDGPAIEDVDGNKEWFLNGARHRLDGPAVVYPGGFGLWYVNGEFIFQTDRSGDIIVTLP